MAIWLIAAALLMKMAVPQGFMPVATNGAIVLELCSGTGPETVGAAMPGMAHHGDASHLVGDPTPCGFDGHAAPGLTTVDPGFAVAVPFPAVAAVPIARSRSGRLLPFLRPQLRGPPAIG